MPIHAGCQYGLTEQGRAYAVLAGWHSLLPAAAARGFGHVNHAEIHEAVMRALAGARVCDCGCGAMLHRNESWEVQLLDQHMLNIGAYIEVGCRALCERQS